MISRKKRGVADEGLPRSFVFPGTARVRRRDAVPPEIKPLQNAAFGAETVPAVPAFFPESD